jgi:class 3 adenylate cyclase/predicted ATPase
MDVAAWLRGLGLEQYTRLFRDNDIDGEILRGMTAEDLKELGISSFGHRRRLFNAITVLGGEPTTRSVAQSAPSATSAPALSPSADAERRQLTVMFCDLVGSTALSTRFDPEDLRELIGDYHRAVADTVGRFDGFVAKYMGDGVLIYFGYPRAHEDDAERAVRAGLAVIEAVGQLPARKDLRVRLGIATGLAVVGDLIGGGAAQERGVIGETPNLAARLQTLAEPNTLIIGEATRRQIGGLFVLADLGPQALTGFAEPQSAWRVVGESGMLSRFEALRSGETPLVGRDEEVELLLRRWEQAKSRDGRMVLISGEPGIGKSRLAAALSERINTDPHTRLRYFCSPHYQSSALYPVIVQLERAAGFGRDDQPEEKLDKLETLLGPAAEIGDVSLLAELLSVPGGDRFAPLELTPQRKKERTFGALVHQLEGLAQTQPVLVIFEDLHWIDPTSREFLDLVLAQIDCLPVLLVATFRPEFQPPWVGQAHATAIALNRLGRSDCTGMVERLAGNAALLPPDVIAEIVERTDGVPLFVEEMTRAVLEVGAECGREIAASVPSAGLGVPATLQASLMARLDRLGPAAKEVAQIGAAVGREFSYELAASVGELAEDRLQDALERLVDAGLVFQRGKPPEAAYLFKHALVQDTAYSTLLRGPRRRLHARIAAAVEQQFPEIAQTQPEVLARHCTEAGLVDPAVMHWRNAGEQAARRAANREAIAHFRRALSLNEGRPDGVDRRRTELAILAQLGPALISVHGQPASEVGTAYERAGAVARQLESSVDLVPPLAGLWVFHSTRGQFARAEEISAELFRIARELDNSEVLLQAHHTAWPNCFLRGMPAEAGKHIDAALALYDESRHERHRYLYIGHDPAVCALAFGSVVQWLLGSPERAIRRERAASELVRRLLHPPSLAQVLYWVGECQVARRDVTAVITTANELLEVCDEYRLPQHRTQALILIGWARACSGEVAEGIQRLTEGISAWSGLGLRAHVTPGLCRLAEGYLLGRRYAQGLEQVAQALAIAAETEENWYLARLHHLRAELLLAQNRTADTAEASLQTAVEIARMQGARGWELRASLSLARLRRDQGREAEARDLLAPVYEWFTEGFDTPDLKEAKALLDELG